METTFDIIKNQFPSITFPPPKYNRAVPSYHSTDAIYNQAEQYETEIIDIINTQIANTQSGLQSTPRWFELDGISITDKTNIFFELKSRNCRINSFKDTIIPTAKIEYFKRLSQLNKNKANRLFLLFAFDTDKDNKEYYFIKYEPTLFNTFTKSNRYGNEHFDIPTEYLQPITDIFTKLNSY